MKTHWTQTNAGNLWSSWNLCMMFCSSCSALSIARLQNTAWAEYRILESAKFCGYMCFMCWISTQLIFHTVSAVMTCRTCSNTLHEKLIWISCQATVMTFRTAKYENAWASEKEMKTSKRTAPRCRRSTMKKAEVDSLNWSLEVKNDLIWKNASSLNLGQKSKENSYPPIPSLKLTGCTWKIGRNPKRKGVFQPPIFRGLGKSFRKGTTSDSQNQRHDVACEKVALVSSKTHLFHWAWLGGNAKNPCLIKNLNHVIENRFRRPQIQLT